jgi:hypothetical protein
MDRWTDAPTDRQMYEQADGQEGADGWMLGEINVQHAFRSKEQKLC